METKLKKLILTLFSIFFLSNLIFSQPSNKLDPIDVFDEIFGEIKDVEFVQDDISTSVRHTLRGLHGDFETYKLISCVYGSLFVAVVDMRPNQSTYLTWETF